MRPETDLTRRVGWLLAIRVVVSTVLLGAATLTQAAHGSVPVDPFFSLIGLTYGLTIAYAGTLRFVDRLPWLVDVQLSLDALIVSAFIAVTGGVTSYFSSLYILPIIAAASLHRRRGGFIVACLTAGLYGVLVLMQYLDADVPGASYLKVAAGSLPAPSVAAYTYGANLFGFFAAAWLSGSLAESLQSAGARLEQASTEIADLQALNQHVIDSLPSGLATTDTAFRILTFNRAAATITGLFSAAVVDRAIDEALQVPPAKLEAIAADLGRARTARRIEFQFKRGDGRPIDVGLSAAHLETPGGRAGFLFTFQDLTTIKKLERDAHLQQRLAAVGEMAAGIAHEIRNPLASISGSIQILRQDLPLNPEQDQLMGIVLRESERLNRTIRSFLDYARPQRFAIERIDLGATLNDTALLLRNSSEVRRGHVVDVDVPAAPLWYEADEGQIKQIVWNLATNGLRAMPEGGRLLLAARTGSDQPDGVVVEVHDEGVGIPADEIDRIFQPFHGNFDKGSGLGLAIVHRIVSDYHGSIQVSSQVGRGTRIAVRLPAREAIPA